MIRYHAECTLRKSTKRIFYEKCLDEGFQTLYTVVEVRQKLRGCVPERKFAMSV